MKRKPMHCVYINNVETLLPGNCVVALPSSIQRSSSALNAQWAAELC